MVTIKIEFTEDDLNCILESASFHDNPVTVAELKADGKFDDFIAELQETDFITEIVEGSEDACGNGWLWDFGRDTYEDNKS